MNLHESSSNMMTKWCQNFAKSSGALRQGVLAMPLALGPNTTCYQEFSWKFMKIPHGDSKWLNVHEPPTWADRYTWFHFWHHSLACQKQSSILKSCQWCCTFKEEAPGRKPVKILKVNGLPPLRGRPLMIWGGAEEKSKIDLSEQPLRLWKLVSCNDITTGSLP